MTSPVMQKLAELKTLLVTEIVKALDGGNAPIAVPIPFLEDDTVRYIVTVTSNGVLPDKGDTVPFNDLDVEVLIQITDDICD